MPGVGKRSFINGLRERMYGNPPPTSSLASSYSPFGFAKDEEGKALAAARCCWGPRWNEEGRSYIRMISLLLATLESAGSPISTRWVIQSVIQWVIQWVIQY